MINIILQGLIWFFYGWMVGGLSEWVHPDDKQQGVMFMLIVIVSTGLVAQSYFPMLMMGGK